MARPASAKRTHEPPTSPSRDLARFRLFLDRGVPGPFAHAILLGLDSFDSPAVLKAVSRGLPFKVFEHLRDNTSLSSEALMDLVGIPRRTLTRRKLEGRFLPGESDRLLRVSRLFGQTLELFAGDPSAATQWLSTPKLALGGATPLDLAKTEVGAREVEALVGRLEQGVFS